MKSTYSASYQGFGKETFLGPYQVGYTIKNQEPNDPTNILWNLEAEIEMKFLKPAKIVLEIRPFVSVLQ